MGSRGGFVYGGGTKRNGGDLEVSVNGVGQNYYQNDVETMRKRYSQKITCGLSANGFNHEISICGGLAVEMRNMQLDDYNSIYALWLSCPGMGLNNLDDSQEGINKVNPVAFAHNEKGNAFWEKMGDSTH